MYCDTATVNLPSHLVLYVISACMLVTCIIFCALVWYVSSRSKERAPFAFKTVTCEDQAFKYHFSHLQRSIQSPSALASELYSKGIITEDVRDQTILPNCNTLQERNGIMLIAVGQAISSDPRCFHHFVQILDDEPTTKLLSKMLLDTYSTRFIQSADVHTRHTYSTVVNNTVLSDDIPNNGYRWIAPNIPKFETPGTPHVLDTSPAGICKSPPLLKFEGPLNSKSKQYQGVMEMCQKLYYQHQRKKLNEAVTKITSSDNVPHDIKTLMYIRISIYTLKVQDVNKLIAECQQHDSQNVKLLEAYAHMTSSYVHSHHGDHHKAMECIKQVRSQMCYEVEPSYLTCWACYAEAVNMTRINEGNLTTNVKKDIKHLFDLAIKFSYAGEGWERSMICICHIRKAIVSLSGTTRWLDYNTKYKPTKEDISCAEQHLNALPPELLNEFSQMTHIIVEYYVALSDLNRWRGDMDTAKKHAQKAKDLSAKIGQTDNGIDERLKPDSIEQVLEEYASHC